MTIIQTLMNVRSSMAAVTRDVPTSLVVTDAPVLKVMTWRVTAEHVKVADSEACMEHCSTIFHVLQILMSACC